MSAMRSTRLTSISSGSTWPQDNLWGPRKPIPHPHPNSCRRAALCFPVFSSTWGNPEVGGGDKF